MESRIEHVLLHADTFIGSVQRQTRTLWVLDDQRFEMVLRSICYVPGLFRIFDEILLNAADIKRHDTDVKRLEVFIDVDDNYVSVYSDGTDVPVEIDHKANLYVPELIFSHLLINTKKKFRGRKEYGANMTNVFSSEFVIEIADGRRQLQYRQVFSNNMRQKSEPVITNCKEDENWTKITFRPDFAKFKMTRLEDDVVALMKKRVVDMAGCLGRTVSVSLNGKPVPFNTFPAYVSLYLNSASAVSLLPSIHETVHERRDVCVSLSGGKFQQVSFVNSVATINGGTHVDHVANQIARHVTHAINKKHKNANITARAVKNHLWVFVNAYIDNPTFDSQTKETLRLRQRTVRSQCKLSKQFFQKRLRQRTVRSQCKLSKQFLQKVAQSAIVESVLSRVDFEPSKDPGKTDVIEKGKTLKLEDAVDVGGTLADTVTSASNQNLEKQKKSISEIEKQGREAIDKDSNKGSGSDLDTDECSSSSGSTDSDEGSDADSGDGETEKSSGSNLDSDEWSSISDSSDSDTDDELFREPEGDIYQDDAYACLFIPVYDQIPKADGEVVMGDKAFCFIPSVVDGLNQIQRMVLFCLFELDSDEKRTVASLCNLVDSRYVDPDEKCIVNGFPFIEKTKCIASTIIGMAHTFVGSNNINILMPYCAFGSRWRGGRDHGNLSGIYTNTSQITRYLFPKDDRILVNGESVEPTRYMPIIPMILVNGIGGCQSPIPKFNPLDIIADLRRMLSGEELVAMKPWFRGFRGTIEETYSEQAGIGYTVSGILEKIDDTKFRIVELPINTRIIDYIAFLKKLSENNGETGQPFLKGVTNNGNTSKVDFEITLSEASTTATEQELMKTLGLTSTVSMSHVPLFDSDGVLKQYNRPEEILLEFFKLRLGLYERRKDLLLRSLLLELSMLKKKLKLVLSVIKQKLVLTGLAGRSDLFRRMREKNIISASDNDVDHEYLLRLTLGTFWNPHVLCADKRKVMRKIAELEKGTPGSLWRKDLEALEEHLTKLCQMDEGEESIDEFEGVPETDSEEEDLSELEEPLCV